MAQLTLLGAGLMGSAVGKTLLSQGHAVHIWNRTPGKTRALEQAGAVCHADVGTALDEGDGVILLLSNHAIANQVLEKVSDRLRGKDVLDLMTGGLQHARRLASLAGTAGAHYLDGVIANFPGEIGTPEALIYICGDEGAWRRQCQSLYALAPATHYLGTRIGAAAEVDAALAGAFGTVAMGAWMEALAFLSDAGIDLKSPAFNIDWWMRHLARDMAQAVEEVRTGDFSTHDATLAVNAAALSQWRQLLIDRGHLAGIMTAALHNLEVAVAAGYGEQSWSAQVQILRTRKP